MKNKPVILLPESVHAHLCPVCFDLKTDCLTHKWNGYGVCNKRGYKNCICSPDKDENLAKKKTNRILV